MKDLVIAPHIDDEVLGCSSILDKDTFVYYCGIDESQIVVDPEHRIGVEKRKLEAKSVAAFYGFTYGINIETRVNSYERDKGYLKGLIQDIINTIEPDRIFIPFPSYNQDHQTVYDAAQIALRPHDKNFFVKKVLVYEQCHSLIWEHKPFNVNYFIPIDIEKKIKGYKLHKSQVRSMRSPELIKAIAKLRGSQSNCDFAEAFQVQRWVE